MKRICLSSLSSTGPWSLGQRNFHVSDFEGLDVIIQEGRFFKSHVNCGFLTCETSPDNQMSGIFQMFLNVQARDFSIVLSNSLDDYMTQEILQEVTEVAPESFYKSGCGLWS